MAQTLEDKLLAMEIDGFCVVNDVIPAVEVGAVRDSIYETRDAAGGSNPGGEPAPPGGYHSDWPYGSSQGSFIAPPKPDVCMNMPCFFMLTEFTRQNGATVVVPGSHRHSGNPNGDPKLRQARPSEIQITGKAGSVLIMYGRIWHKGGNNCSSERRMYAGVSYVPWWLNCHARRPCSVEHRIWKDAGLIPSGGWPFIKADVYDRLPKNVQPLVRHWVDREWVMTREESEATIMDASSESG